MLHRSVETTTVSGQENWEFGSEKARYVPEGNMTLLFKRSQSVASEKFSITSDGNLLLFEPNGPIRTTSALTRKPSEGECK